MVGLLAQITHQEDYFQCTPCTPLVEKVGGQCPPLIPSGCAAHEPKQCKVEVGLNTSNKLHQRALPSNNDSLGPHESAIQACLVISIGLSFLHDLHQCLTHGQTDHGTSVYNSRPHIAACYS